MNTKIINVLRKNSYPLALGVMCVMMSFTIGVQTAGDVQPFALIEAGSSDAEGDMDGDGIITIQDALTILEIAQGYREPTLDQMKADPNKDGSLTVDDAIRLLHIVAVR